MAQLPQLPATSPASFVHQMIHPTGLFNPFYQYHPQLGLLPHPAAAVPQPQLPSATTAVPPPADAADSTSSSSCCSSSGSGVTSPLLASPPLVVHNSLPLAVPRNISPTAASSAAGGSPRIELLNRDLWAKFHRVTNEMVVTRTGRKMFPKLELRLHGLNPHDKYSVTLLMRQLDTTRHKYQAGCWSQAGQGDDGSPMRTKEVHHHDGLWMRGEFWESQDKVCFDRVKLTNRQEVESNTLLSLCSMHKYQPVVCLYVYNEHTQQMVLLCTLELPETQFIAVTAYQNESVIKLKVEHNPFAKGFREGSSRKRTLSPSSASPPAMLSGLHSPSAAVVPAKRRLLCPPPPTLPSLPLLPLYSPNSASSSASYWPSMAFLASMASMAQQQHQQQIAGGTTTSAQHQQQQHPQLELAKMYSQWWQQQQMNNTNTAATGTGGNAADGTKTATTTTTTAKQVA